MVTRPSPMEIIKKIAKFFWRHFFTLGNLAIGFAAFMEGPLNWKNGLYMTIAAAFLDWAKQFIKLTPNSNRRHSSPHGSVDFNSYNNSDWSNPRIIGSDTYLMNQSRETYN